MRKNSRGGGKKRFNSRNNPKRGPPGVLFYCETGRESKCLREGLEILNHYYSPNNEKVDDNTTSSAKGDGHGHDDADADGNKEDGTTGEKKMTLDEEIAMLKKNKKNGPFRVYETGSRGTVFVMYSVNKQNKNKQPHPNEENASKRKYEDKLSSNNDDETIESNEVASSKRKRDDTDDADVQTLKNNENTNVEVNSKKQKMDTSASSITPQEQCNWDPITTVQSIIQGIINNDSAAPRSRFVSRMIPMQATCYANMEEIKLTATSIINNHLIPYGIKANDDYQNDDASATVTNTTNNKMKQNEKSLPSFKIEFRKRHCSHIKRNDVIQSVAADIVEASTKEYWNQIHKKDNNDAALSNENQKQEASDTPQLFSVDQTVIIEICQTLCAMSVVKDVKEGFHNFNLIKQENNGKVTIKINYLYNGRDHIYDARS